MADTSSRPPANPAQPERRLAYRGAAWAFGLALGLSLVALAALLIMTWANGGRSPLSADEGESNLALILSTATTVVSLIGLLSTNLMAWRREARLAREAEVDLQRQRLELERLRFELEKERRKEETIGK